MASPRVSAAIICLDEERDLPGCLDSVSWCDEVVVVIDTKTSDRTAAIAKAAGARVYFREWSGWSDQKNFAFQHCSSDWILSIDADERITDALRAEIAEKLPSAEATGYFVPRQNYWMGKWVRHGGWYPDYTLRLFRRGHGICRYLVHERIEVDGIVATLQHPLVHINIQQLNEHLTTMLRATRAEAIEMQANGARFYYLPPLHSMRAYVTDLRSARPTRLRVYLLAKEHFKNRVEIVWLVPILPVLKFTHMYVIKGGFRDGVHGFWLAALSAIYVVVKYCQFWALWREGNPRPDRAGAPTVVSR